MFTAHYPLADLEAAGAWTQLENLKDPELQELAKVVPDTLLGGKADSSTLALSRDGSRGQRQGRRSRVSPTQEAHIVLYLQHLSQTVQSKSAIEEVVNALSSGSWAATGCRLRWQGIGECWHNQRCGKEPVTAEMLKAMVDAAGPEPSLSEVRLRAVCLLAFAGYLRCEELLKLVCADVEFDAEGLVLSIKSSKTDQLKRVLKRGGAKYRPLSPHASHGTS